MECDSGRFDVFTFQHTNVHQRAQHRTLGKQMHINPSYTLTHIVRTQKHACLQSTYWPHCLQHSILRCQYNAVDCTLSCIEATADRIRSCDISACNTCSDCNTRLLTPPTRNDMIRTVAVILAAHVVQQKVSLA